MTTYPFEPGPYALIGLPFFLVMAYATYRGLRFSEFRLRGEWGWHKAKPLGFDYWLGTLVNLALLASFALMIFWKR